MWKIHSNVSLCLCPSEFLSWYIFGEANSCYPPYGCRGQLCVFNYHFVHVSCPYSYANLSLYIASLYKFLKFFCSFSLKSPLLFLEFTQSLPYFSSNQLHQWHWSLLLHSLMSVPLCITTLLLSPFIPYKWQLNKSWHFFCRITCSCLVIIH